MEYVDTTAYYGTDADNLNDAISEDVISTFLSRELTYELEVPFLSEETKKVLGQRGIGNTFQLIGFVMTFLDVTYMSSNDLAKAVLKELNLNKADDEKFMKLIIEKIKYNLPNSVRIERSYEEEDSLF